MNSARRRKAYELFNDALDRDSAERSEFLGRVCAGDAALRAEVESLIAADARAAGFLDPLFEHTITGGRRAAGVLTCEIEGYEIEREIGRGGQGVVYEALQAATKRMVAIKVLLGGRHSPAAALRRFEREIELVAQLKHPNIISVFHTGMTNDGCPYYVMDYVDGVTLREYVRQNSLPLERALELFGTICQAIQYAHQRGVIHRDLKPTNILVEADGVPRILDFGLAKQVETPTETVVTLSQQIVGTLPYMSPEQARGDAQEIDTRTDVYALGVILYELLTGQYPYPVVGHLADVLKHIAETVPVPPTRRWRRGSGVSTRVSRRIRFGQCPIDDEVQTIALKALAKERERRYESAGALARDVQRYLAGEAIEAKRESFWYVLRKLVRRNLPQTIAVASVATILISAASITINYVRIAWSERAEAEHTSEMLSKEVADYDDIARATQQPFFSAFVLEWRQDNLTQARRVLAMMMPQAPEAVAAGFLLDETISAGELLTRIPPEAHAVAYLAIGERALQSGDSEAAREAFERGLREESIDWWRTILETRLWQVSGP